MKDKQLDFLLINSGLVIKHLLLTSISDTESESYKSNYKTLLNSPIISYWKKNIPTQVNLYTILGSSDSCFENSFAKLLSFGLKINDILSEKAIKKYLLFLKNEKFSNVYDFLARYIVAGYFYAAGLSNDIVYNIVKDRINTLYDFVSKSPFKFNIYLEPSDFKIPSQYKSKKLVNPVLYSNNELILPLIYDIFIFHYIYDKLSLSLKKKIDLIIDYVADSRYQSFDYGYGLIKESNKYHFMGWSAHLPFFNENLSINYFKKFLVQRMVLFSKFKNSKIKKWLDQQKVSLEKFKINDFQFYFSNEYLPEIKNSYFLIGSHMGLNEDRKKKSGKILESTYYMNTLY